MPTREYTRRIESYKAGTYFRPDRYIQVQMENDALDSPASMFSKEPADSRIAYEVHKYRKSDFAGRVKMLVSLANHWPRLLMHVMHIVHKDRTVKGQQPAKGLRSILEEVRMYNLQEEEKMASLLRMKKATKVIQKKPIKKEKGSSPVRPVLRMMGASSDLES